MLYLRSFTGFSIHLECWNGFRFGQSNKFWKKSWKKKLDTQVWVLSRSSRGRPENVLGTSRINLPGTPLERQIKTSPRRQIGMPPGQSNRIFRGRPGYVGGVRPWDVLGTNICWLRWALLLWRWEKYSNIYIYIYIYIYLCKINKSGLLE